jgi:tripartite-type tricarboxylate transporter receptor subunit TctC
MTNALRTVTAGALLAAACFGAAAEEPYPNKPIRIFIPFAAGGAVDTMIRLVGPDITAQLGQPVVVENKPGGGAQIAASAMTSLPTDGYSLMAAEIGALAINPTLYKKITYQPVRDFDGVAYLARTPMVMFGSPTGPISGMPAFKAKLATPHANISYGSPGPGTAPHVLGHLLARANPKVAFMHVPYKGMPPAQQAIMSGEIDMLFDGVPGTLNLVKAKKAVPLAVAADKRSEYLPDVPTTAEIGYPNMVMDLWIGVVAKKGTPPAIVQRLHDAFEKAIAKPEVWNKLAELGYSRRTMSAAQFDQFIKAEIEHYRPLVIETGVTVD